MFGDAKSSKYQKSIHIVANVIYRFREGPRERESGREKEQQNQQQQQTVLQEDIASENAAIPVQCTLSLASSRKAEPDSMLGVWDPRQYAFDFCSVLSHNCSSAVNVLSLSLSLLRLLFFHLLAQCKVTALKIVASRCGFTYIHFTHTHPSYNGPTNFLHHRYMFYAVTLSFFYDFHSPCNGTPFTS